MQICKRLLYAGILSLSLFLLNGQTMPEMPEFPEISAPTLGSGFYKPKIPYYPKAKNPTTESENSSEKDKNETVLTDGTTTTDLLSSILNTNDFLTAQDITSLSNAGSLSSLSGLLGTNTSSDNLSNNLLLQQILQSLEELKAEKKEEITAGTTESLKVHAPSVLRFKINNYNIKDSLTTVYISSQENDGSFLMTADRRYIADKKVRNETFYLLFKTKENSGSVITYDVSPSINQDSKNENSFLYKLCSQKNLSAQKTGNLVVLRSSSKDCEADLLIDLDNN